MKYDFSYKVYGTVEIEAENYKTAIELFNQVSDLQILDCIEGVGAITDGAIDVELYSVLDEDGDEFYAEGRNIKYEQ
jgi:hypothetical protein